MAFCTSCGATLEPSARFCTKCGTSVPLVATPQSTGSGAAVQPAMQSVPPPTSGNALKLILIIVAIVVGLGIVSVVGLTFFGLRMARSLKVETNGEHSRVVTPFGTVESSADAIAALKSQGVDVDPGARQLPGAASVNLGPMKTVTASFETPDPPAAVAAWYRARFPRSQISVSDQNQQTLVFGNNQGMITIVIAPQGNKTQIQISNVAGMGKPSAGRQPN